MERKPSYFPVTDKSAVIAPAKNLPQVRKTALDWRKLTARNRQVKAD
jgi:hypothetical protein